jgi:integrase
VCAPGKLRARGLKAISVRKYRHFLEKQLLPFARSTGKTRLQQLDVEALRAFRASWKFKATTQQKKLETLRAFFRFCASAGWVESNPAPAVKLPRVHQVPTLPFTEEEIDKLLDACDRFRGNGARLRAMILLLRHFRLAGRRCGWTETGQDCGRHAVPLHAEDRDTGADPLAHARLRSPGRAARGRLVLLVGSRPSQVGDRGLPAELSRPSPSSRK